MNKNTAAEMLAMLNPKPCSFSTFGRGGVGSVGPLDIAAALAGLRDIQHYLLRAKYADDQEFLFRAGKELVILMDDRDLGLPRPAEFSELQMIADYIVCAVVTAGRCKTCEGTGVVVDAERGLESCPKCDGTGKRPDSLSFIAKSCGYDHKTFKKRGYVDFVKWWVSELYVLEDAGLGHIARNLSDRAAA